MEAYKIRQAKIEDKVAVNEAHKRSIREVCSKDYNSEQIEKWSNVTYDDKIWENGIKNHFYYVVEVNGKVEGMCHALVHDDHITGEIFGLYLTPQAIGLGAGRELVEMAMDWMKVQAPITKVVISGTKTAKPFYEKMGFKAKGGPAKEEIRGAILDCYDMELIL